MKTQMSKNVQQVLNLYEKAELADTIGLVGLLLIPLYLLWFGLVRPDWSIGIASGTAFLVIFGILELVSHKMHVKALDSFIEEREKLSIEERIELHALHKR